MADFKRYNPNRSADWNYGGKKWRLSRSKIEFFIECPRCFYVDNKLGTKRPGYPEFTLNKAVDQLFKREFDAHRKAGTPHPLMEQYGITAVPFSHAQMDTWRENFEGVEYKDDATGFVISGAVDDIWVDENGRLIVVDYKSTSKDGKIEVLGDSSWNQQYKRQMGVYQWLLRKNGFDVADMGYLVYANADGDKEAFDGKLEFEVTVVECPGEADWIDAVLPRIKETLESEAIPPVGDACEFCPYREAAGKKLLALHQKSRKS